MSNGNILVVGGAGYIGSHMVKTLHEAGYEVTVLDNLSSGHRDAVQWGRFVQGDLGDRALLDSLFAAHKIDAVMHFAGLIQVGESIQHPALYYENNVCKTMSLMDAMVANGVNQLVFSSTAAIFGEPDYVPIDEAHPSRPINPYGMSKRMVEQMLADYDSAYGLKSVCLRYFNAAGADPSGLLGERHEPETHLIPIALEVALGVRAQLNVFGDNYDTPDGTCIRDYVHVSDLCAAHMLALQHLKRHGTSASVNLGNGKGFSVREVISAIEKITRHNLNISISPRRQGDPAILVADSDLARVLLGWQPKYADLETIVSHAWAWAKSCHHKSSIL